MDSHTILCVDDHRQALELRRVALQSYGYTVKTASSGYAAMRILEGTSISAVLLEYKQEGMDAEAIACHIKQQFPKMPIVLVSAFSEMQERILWLVDEYVMKGEPTEGLVLVIERLTRSHQFPPSSHESHQRGGTAA